MRLFVFLFFAVGLNAADIGSPIPFPRDEEGTSRANIKETSQPFQANAAKASTAKETGCEKCGLACECGLGCECTAAYWKDHCKAVPSAQRAAYYRSLQSVQAPRPTTARSVPARPFPQTGEYPMTQTIPAIGVGGINTSSRGSIQMGRIGIGAPRAGMFGSTDAGCASGG